MIHATRANRRDETLRRFLGEARRIVLTDGLDGLTVGRLASAAGYTPGAMYRYFPSKGALIAALDQQILEGWRAAFAALAAEPPLVALLAGADLLARLSVERREDFALIGATLSDPRQLVDDLADAVHLPTTAQLLGDVAAVVARAAEAGDVSEGEAHPRAIRFVFGTLGVLQVHKLARVAPDLFEPRALARGLASDLLTAWGAAPGALSDATPLAGPALARAWAVLESR